MSFFSMTVGNAVNRFCYLISEDNPFDVFKSKGAGTFDSVLDVLTPILKDTYVVVIVIGICLMAIAGVAAITVLSLSKNDKKVGDNKSWLMRIIIGVAGLGLFLSAITIVWKVSQKVDSSLEGESATSVPVAQVREIPYHEVDGLI